MGREDNFKGKGKATRFSSTNQPKSNGRKKKIYNILKEKGYSKDDISTCFSELGFYTIQEAQEVCLDETKPIIMQIIAKCFIKAYEDGDWSKCKDIIDQTLGKATQKHEVNGMQDIFSKIKIEEDFGEESNT